MALSPSLEHFLHTMEYPATRDDLVREASRDGVEPADLDMLRDLPEQSYSARWQVAFALSRVAQRERTLVAA